MKNKENIEKVSKVDDNVKFDKKIMIIIISIIILLIAFDQICKAIVVNNFSEPIGFYLMKINYTLNTGMALGLNEGNNRNIVITIVILILILNFAINQKDRIDKKTAVSLCLIAAGGISNLIDRFIYKGVVDFIDIIGFPIFNFADLYVVVGWILLIICVYKYSTKKE